MRPNFIHTTFSAARFKCRWMVLFVWLILFGTQLFLGSEAHARSPQPNTILNQQAVVTFTDPRGGLQTVVVSNRLEVVVQSVSSATLTGDAAVRRTAGGAFSIPYTLSNTGNTDLEFDFGVANIATCAGETAGVNLNNLQVVVDTNSNGIPDASEASRPASASLQAGASLSLIVTGNAPINPETACIQIQARSTNSSVLEQVQTQVRLQPGPVIVLRKSSSQTAPLVPGSADRATFTIEASNVGTTAASRMSPSAPQQILIDGIASTSFVLRDVIPLNSQYVRGTLSSSHDQATRLFRTASSDPFSYTTSDPGPEAVEVALAFPFDIERNQSVRMSFDITAQAQAFDQINNTAQALYCETSGCATFVQSTSNMAIASVATHRLGVAHWVEGWRVNTNAEGQPDNTLTYTMGVRVLNSGTVTLHNIQLQHPLSGMSRFGQYTTNTLPAPNQYTLVSGSFKAVQKLNSVTAINLNNDFNGDTNTQLLLPGINGSVLPPNAEFTLYYDVRVNIKNRDNQTILSQLEAQASLSPVTATADARNRSTQGNNPDPDGDGNPYNNNEPTPVDFPSMSTIVDLAQGLTMSVTLEGFRKIRASSGDANDNNTFEADFVITVRNQTDRQTPKLRLVKNLSCPLDILESSANVASWSLQGQPTLVRGTLNISPLYTGDGGCDGYQQTSAPPTGRSYPAPHPKSTVTTPPQLILNNVNDTLAPRSDAEIRVTVRIVKKDARLPLRFNNEVWLLGTKDNNLIDTQVKSSLVTLLDVQLVDPQGFVYDSVTRQGLEGAVVTLTRQSCDSGVVTAIRPNEIFDGTNSRFTFNPDGSVSLVTDSTGEYAFVLQSPPVNDFCTYGIRVEPPPNYTRSNLFPPQPGVYTGCGFVVNEDTPPKGPNTPITWFEQVRAGGKIGPPVEACPVMHNHIPLDPVGLSKSLLVEKKSNKTQVELGDVVDYTIRLANQADTDIQDIVIEDLLPPGFVMVKGSARLNNNPLSDPTYQRAEARGRTLMRFDLGNTTLLNGESLQVSYRMRVGVGAMIDTDAINTATVFANTQIGPTPLRSLPAQAKVRVQGGVFSNQGYALGRVWADCNRNGIQDNDTEPGIAGVRLYLEDGTSVVTDAFGRWSLQGLRPGTRVIRLDTTTLPAGASVLLTSQRQAGQAHSRFLDIKNGELVRADFAIDACGSETILEQINQRHQEGLSTLQTQAGQDPKAQFDQRAGTSTTTSNTARSFQSVRQSALIDVASSQPLRSLTDTLLGPLATFSPVPLETWVKDLTPELQFLELEDGNTVLQRQMNIRVSGPSAGDLVLKLNGQVVPTQRVGKRITVESSGVQALEFIAVELAEGRNELQLQLLDPFGNVRQNQTIHVVAPGRLSQVAVDTASTLYADPALTQNISIRLLDSQGIPITARTAISLSAADIEWLTPDLNPDEPGLQVLSQNGEAQIALRSPRLPGNIRLRINVGDITHEQDLTFLPSLTALQGIGIVEGVINLGNAGRLTLSQPQASNAFERELTALSNSGHTSGRVAFYFKGTIKGEYLLTAAYDSDKPTRQSAIQNIQPEQFYPVYGDASVSSNDAQSSGRLFVRIDKNLSYLLLGDINTASSPEVRTLSQYSRNLPGVQHQFQNDQVRITSFYAETTSRQQVEEIPATGLSFYNIQSRLGDIRPGSERVEVLVRDRQQAQRVISTTRLSAMSDYSFEALTGRLFLVEPLASFDANLNPQFIRITYELENGGELSPVMGTDVQVKISEQVQLGGVFIKDDNPETSNTLQALTLVAKTQGGTQLSAELAQSQTDDHGRGYGARVNIEHKQGPITAQANVTSTQRQFISLGSTSSAGRTDLAASVDYAVSADTRIRVDGSVSQSDEANATKAQRTSVGVSVANRWNEQVSTELGVRRTEGSGGERLGLDTSQVSNVAGVSPTAAGTLTNQPTIEGTTVRGKLTVRPSAVPRLQVSTEYEQSTESNQRSLTTGVDYALTAATRAYLRHSRLSGINSGDGINGQNLQQALVIGLDSAYSEGGRVYNEYRLNNGTAQNATGLRQTYKLNEQWRLSGGLEHTRTLGSNPVGDNSNTQSASGSSTTVSLGADWTDGPWRVAGSIERRLATAGNAWLYNLAASWRLQHDLTVLARTTSSQTKRADGLDRQRRDQIGLAWRPAYADQWNILSRYERRLERQSLSHIFSLHGNYQIDRKQNLSVRQAAKLTHTRDDIADSRFWLHLSHARYTVDFAPNWDLGLQLGHLWGRDGSRDTAVGLEVGRQLVSGLWLSVGHNIRGLSAPELVGQNYTSQGSYIRLRWKFDESVFQFGRVANTSSSSNSQATPSSPQ